jgi:DNA-binding GntR family transcriptional regulator
VAKITPVIATRDLATKLKIRPGNPLLRIAQTDYSINEKPILFSIEYHLPDAFVFLVNRKGPHW